MRHVLVPLSLCATLVSSTSAAIRAQTPKVEASVLERLQEERSPYVIVLVRQGDVSVPEAQQRVLSRLPEDAFEPVYLWDNVAGFSGRASAEALALLEADPNVRAVGLDEAGRPLMGSSVPHIKADQVQSLGITGAGVTVALIDSGVKGSHPDLAGDIASGGRHFTDQGGDVGMDIEDDFGHGTAVAGTITSDGITGPVGVAPDAKLLVVRVVAQDGTTWLSDWVSAVDHVITEAPRHERLAAINMSLGTIATYSDCPCEGVSAIHQALEDAIAEARAQGILTFAASGNSGECDAMPSPACLSSAIAVAATYEEDLGTEPGGLQTYSDLFGQSFAACFDTTTQADQVTCFSNRSACNDLAAPGRRITTLGIAGPVAEWTGTSVAAPHVSGTLALLTQGSHKVSAEELLELLRSTGVPTIDPCAMHPPPVRIDALAALQAAVPFESYCSGDGGDQAGCTDCPCGNDAAPGTEGGCLNSAGASARLVPGGRPRVSADTLRFEGEGLPALSTSILVSGDNRLPANPMSPCFGLDSGLGTAGDGLRCTGGNFQRHGSRLSSAAGEVGVTTNGWGTPNGPAGGIAAQGGFAAGQTRHFQIFYRDVPHAACTGEFSSSQGVTVTFEP